MRRRLVRRCKVVIEPSKAVAQGGVFFSDLLELVCELVVVAGEFVDPGGEIRGVKGVELLAELMAERIAQAVAFLTEVFDLFTRMRSRP
ncbi:hypothetical protein [Streptomyces sp. NPDC058424]|uniref:hypothetical protein n=1 Tax=Streptomyces sp. NPDC058424 TaxID=3346491 RepID=UPI00364B6E4F